jgi:rare lipoprotein A
MKWHHFVVFMLLLVALAGPARLMSQQAGPQEIRVQEAAPPEQNEKDGAERGYAAFYSESLEGHKTACGGTYDSRQLTAAHPKLRCGTKVRVINLRNGRTARVTVNDRGPLTQGSSSHNRIIDLSYAAARRLDFIKQGTTLVKVEVIR